MKKKKKRQSPFGWIILLIIVCLPLVYFGRRFHKFINMRHEVLNARREVIVLEAELEVIRSRIKEYRRGNLVEAKARDDLGMMRKGEKIYLIQRK